MEFFQESEPDLKKPIIIAAMSDMGNVGGIVVDFINDNLKTKKFRTAKTSYPSYVVDKGGSIELPDEKWEYRYADDFIVFGGGMGQPQSNEELHALCQDVIDVSKKYSAKFIYTLGGFHTNRQLGKDPQTFVTATSIQLKEQLEKSKFETTPQKSPGDHHKRTIGEPPARVNIGSLSGQCRRFAFAKGWAAIVVCAAIEGLGGFR